MLLLLLLLLLLFTRDCFRDDSAFHYGELGWRSGESARLPPMCPGFDSRTRRHMWVEFVVGSRPSSEGFSPGSPVFLPPQKSTFLNSNSIGNSRATGLSVEDCYVLPSLNKVNFIYSLREKVAQLNLTINLIFAT